MAARISASGHEVAPWSDVRLRISAALVGGGLPAIVGVAGLFGGLPVLVFAFIAVAPGILIGLSHGPNAARTDKPISTGLGLALRGFLLTAVLNVALLLVLAGIQAWFGQPASNGGLSLIQNLGWMLMWGIPALLLGGLPASVALSFTGVALIRAVAGHQVTFTNADRAG